MGRFEAANAVADRKQGLHAALAGAHPIWPPRRSRGSCCPDKRCHLITPRSQLPTAGRSMRPPSSGACSIRAHRAAATCSARAAPGPARRAPSTTTYEASRLGGSGCFRVTASLGQAPKIARCSRPCRPRRLPAGIAASTDGLSDHQASWRRPPGLMGSHHRAWSPPRSPRAGCGCHQQEGAGVTGPQPPHFMGGADGIRPHRSATARPRGVSWCAPGARQQPVHLERSGSQAGEGNGQRPKQGGSGNPACAGSATSRRLGRRQWPWLAGPQRAPRDQLPLPGRAALPTAPPWWLWMSVNF